MTPAIEVINLCKSFSYPTHLPLLREIYLTIHKGESVAITGRSGEGKSTLLHILGTLEAPSSGTIQIMGNSVGRYNVNTLRARHLGFIFQSFHLLEGTVLDNILMPARILRQPLHEGSTTYQRALQLLEEVKLYDRMHYHVKNLSGGGKQRVALARALCNNPDIILADEPSGNLDQNTAGTIHHLLLNCAKVKNKGLIVVTHDLEFASLCDTHYHLTEGRLEKCPTKKLS